MEPKFLFLNETLLMKFTHVTLLLLLPLFCQGQEMVSPRPSPLAMVQSRYKDTYLKITYSQPSKRGRTVFGGLVPWDAVWRTGANEATEITLTRDIKINGMDLTAGTYSLFTIPHQNKWSVIFNNDLGLWGAYNYNPKQDVLRFDVPSTRSRDVVYESFTIQLNSRNDRADLLMVWDDTQVVIPIQFQDQKL
jgi:hypothetical protein